MTTTQEKIDCLKSFDFGVYEVNDNLFVVADPISDEDGYYLELDNLPELLLEAIEHTIGDSDDFLENYPAIVNEVYGEKL